MKTNKYIFSVLLLFVGYLVCSCGDSSQPVAPKIKNVPAQITPIKNVKSWPPENTTGLSLAKDLLGKNYYILLDISGSMADKECSDGEGKLVVAKSSLMQFAEILPLESNLGLMVFSGNKIQELTPLSPTNIGTLAKTLSTVYASGGTPLGTAMDSAFRKLEEQAIKQQGYGEYNLVVITDGEADAGENPAHIVADILGGTSIQIHTIGFCIGSNHPLNLAGRTVYREANNPADLNKGLQAVLSEAEVFDVTSFE